jgi:hypothetical protein
MYWKIELYSFHSCVQLITMSYMAYFQWPHGLRRSPAAIVSSNPTGAWRFVCCVLSGRGLCDELITRLEESYRLWSVVVCDQETSWTRRP